MVVRTDLLMRNEVRVGVEKQNLWCTAQSTLLHGIFVCYTSFTWKPSECLTVFVCFGTLLVLKLCVTNGTVRKYVFKLASKHTTCLSLVGQKDSPASNSRHWMSRCCSFASWNSKNVQTEIRFFLFNCALHCDLF